MFFFCFRDLLSIFFPNSPKFGFSNNFNILFLNMQKENLEIDRKVENSEKKSAKLKNFILYVKSNESIQNLYRKKNIELNAIELWLSLYLKLKDLSGKKTTFSRTSYTLIFYLVL
jgi:hypothetical protein